MFVRARFRKKTPTADSSGHAGRDSLPCDRGLSHLISTFIAFDLGSNSLVISNQLDDLVLTKLNDSVPVIPVNGLWSPF